MRASTATYVAVSCIAVALAFPAGAGAVICVPPGTSGVDQYFETIPGASCNVAPPGSSVGGSSGRGNSGGGGTAAGVGGRGAELSAAAARQLAAEGPAGRAVARLVAETGPPATVASARRHGVPGAAAGARPSAAGAGANVASSGGHGPIAGLFGPILSGAPGGSGPLLAIFLAAALAIGILVAVLRRRRS